MIKIALVVPQKNNALDELRRFIAQPADMYIFPEGFLSADILGEALEIIRQNGSFVITGCKSGGYEKALVIDRGEIIDEYSKCILTPGEKQKGKIPGSTIRCVDSRFGRIAVPVCYEIHFPEAARIMCLERPVLMVNLIGKGMYHELQYSQWTAIARARAIENETAILGCCHYCGEIPLAFAYSNDGTALLEAKNEYGVHIVELDLEQTNRQNINYLADRKPELFGRLCERGNCDE